MTLKKLRGEGFVGGRPEARGFISEDRFSVTWGFREADATGDDGFEKAITKVILDLGNHLVGEIIAHKHRHENSADHEVGVGPTISNILNDLGDFTQALQGEVFTLQGDEKFIRRSQRVGHQNAERGRTIEKDKIKRGVVAERLKGGAEAG